MDFLEAKALKSSFHWELAMESAEQDDLVEEILCFNGANLVAGEDFEVDEFFNFSNGDFENGSDEDEEFENKRYSVSSSLNQSGEFPAVGEVDSNSVLAVDLAFPGDALADLEWVSQFVDDSCSEFSCAAVASEPEKKLAGAVISRLPTFYPVRPRTKRSRPSSSSSSSTSSGVSFAAGENVDSCNTSDKPPMKQGKRSSSAAGGQFPRRCSHCLVQKTPQWRTGPYGAKTLCNACGVRYKSGRLFPEYRPALSPTFCSGVHSNSHRKVVEMRKMKEVPEPATELTPMVPTYQPTEPTGLVGPDIHFVLDG